MACRGNADYRVSVLHSAACPDYACSTPGAPSTLPEDGGSLTAHLTAQYRLQRHARLGCLDHLHRCRGTCFAVVVVLLPSPTIPWHLHVEVQSTSIWPLLHHVVVDGQGELAMHSAHSLVATWRNCPRRGPPPYNVGSLPGRALVRHSTATARASPHLGCEFLGGGGVCDSIGLRGCSHRAFVQCGRESTAFSCVTSHAPANIGISYS